MKKSRFTIYIVGALISIGALSVTFYSCEKEQIIPSSPIEERTHDETNIDLPDLIPSPDGYCGKLYKMALLNNRKANVGGVLVYNDSRFFYVILSARQGYIFQDAFLHTCDEFDELPLNVYDKPDLSAFNHSIIDRPDAYMRIFKIPIADVRGSTFVSVAVEMKTRSTESYPSKKTIAWVDGKFYDPNKTGRVFTYTNQLCLANPATTENQ